MKSTVSWVFEDLKFKISEGYNQFWSEPSEILILRSSTTPETEAFTSYGHVVRDFESEAKTR